MRRLDPADAGLLGAVAVLEVVDRVMRGDGAGALDEAVGHRAQLCDLGRTQHVRHHDGADALVFVLLGLGEHGASLPHDLYQRCAARCASRMLSAGFCWPVTTRANMSTTTQFSPTAPAAGVIGPR